MNITKLYHEASDGNSGLTEGTTINIDTPTDINGRTGYRRVYYLRFKFDSYANAIRLHTDSSKLESRFDHYLLHLTEHNDTFQTGDWQIAEENALVKVHLTHPWRLNKVKTWDYRGMDILRLDGDALSPEPTIKANANSTIAAEFIGQDFAIRKKTTYSPNETTPAAAQANNTLAKGNAMAEESVMALSIGSGSGPNVSIDDITMEDNLGADVSVAVIPAHGINWIQLKSYPTGPRISIGQINQIPDENTQWQTLWNEPGEHRNAVWQPQSKAKELLQQLQTQLDRHFEQAKSEGTPVTSDLFLPVAIESDMPATFRFGDLEINYSLLKNQWDHWTEEQKSAGKETLQFNGGTLHSHPLKLMFPPGASVNKALIHLGTDISETSGFAAGVLSADLQQAKGVHATQGATIAKRLDMAQAQQVNQVALALLPVTEQSSLKITITEDQNGKPKGAVLAEAKVQLHQSNGRQWLVTKLNNSILLDAKQYWLTVSCMDGSQIWLGNSIASNTQGKATSEQNGKLQTITNILLLGELGHSLPASQNTAIGNLTFKFDNNLQPISGDKVDATSLFATVPTAIQLLSGEQGGIVLYSPEIEYS